MDKNAAPTASRKRRLFGRNVSHKSTPSKEAGINKSDSYDLGRLMSATTSRLTALPTVSSYLTTRKCNIQNVVESHESPTSLLFPLMGLALVLPQSFPSTKVTFPSSADRAANNGKKCISLQKPTFLELYRFPVGTVAPIAAQESVSLDGDSVNVCKASDSHSLITKDDGGYNSENDEALDSWRKIRNTMVWTPFIQYAGKHNYPWVQLSGHQGNFRAGSSGGTIMKKYTKNEADCLKAISEDSLRSFAPLFKAVVEKNGEKFTEMQDLLQSFTSPSIMDCKIGIRTYLESELKKAREDPKARNDMYKKMVEVDPNAPTEEENAAQAITKPRYMLFREELSSTSNLAFRIDGIQKSSPTVVNGPAEPCPFDLKRTKNAPDIVKALRYFTDSNATLVRKYIARLEELEKALHHSEFFRKHELIGSSLLFVHDSSCNACVWMIDFGKTFPCPEPITHEAEWIEGNHEDGYLLGLRNLLNLLRSLLDSP